jgi:hypothetical protein
MTTDEKLAAILAAVQTDPGNRGLARDPHDNLFTATKGDFEAACRSIAGAPEPHVALSTGFYIPHGDPPAYETDGPLGTVFLSRAFRPLGIHTSFEGEDDLEFALLAGPLDAGYREPHRVVPQATHHVWIERVGRAADGRCYSMRGRDVTEHHAEFNSLRSPEAVRSLTKFRTIGIGDGGNEIGMGKIHPTTIAKNIPNGERIHCRVPTDHLIVAGVSNWGAYALAAGVYVLRGVKPPADLFDPDREREILEVMVREGPLVDGVTGKQTATVDGLTWDEYAKPLVRIRDILGSE